MTARLVFFVKLTLLIFATYKLEGKISLWEISEWSSFVKKHVKNHVKTVSI